MAGNRDSIRQEIVPDNDLVVPAEPFADGVPLYRMVCQAHRKQVDRLRYPKTRPAGESIGDGSRNQCGLDPLDGREKKKEPYCNASILCPTRQQIPVELTPMTSEEKDGVEKGYWVAENPPMMIRVTGKVQKLQLHSQPPGLKAMKPNRMPLKPDTLGRECAKQRHRGSG